MTDVTQILSELEHGDPAAAERLLPLVYHELRQLAAAKLAHEAPGQTLQATALVHEAYLRLVSAATTEKTDASPWDHHGHFFAAAAVAMRRILVDRARHKRRLKHGGGVRRAEVDIAGLAYPLPDETLLALDEALGKLAATNPSQAQLVQLRFFAGLSNEQAAKALGISAATAKRRWRYARAWLHREIGDQDESPVG